MKDQASPGRASSGFGELGFRVEGLGSTERNDALLASRHHQEVTRTARDARLKRQELLLLGEVSAFARVQGFWKERRMASISECIGLRASCGDLLGCLELGPVFLCKS